MAVVINKDKETDSKILELLFKKDVKLRSWKVLKKFCEKNNIDFARSLDEVSDQNKVYFPKEFDSTMVSQFAIALDKEFEKELKAVNPGFLLLSDLNDAHSVNSMFDYIFDVFGLSNRQITKDLLDHIVISAISDFLTDDQEVEMGKSHVELDICSEDLGVIAYIIADIVREEDHNLDILHLLRLGIKNTTGIMGVQLLTNELVIEE